MDGRLRAIARFVPVLCRVVCQVIWVIVLMASPAIATADQPLLVPEGESIENLQDLRSLALGKIAALSFSRDGRTLASGAEDGTVCLWELASGHPRRCIPQPEGVRQRITTLSFSPKDQWISAGQQDGSVRMWRTDSSSTPAACKLDALREKSLGHPIAALVSTLDGRLLATGSRNGTLRVCEGALERADGRAPSALVPSRSLPRLTGSPSSLFEQVALDPEGRWMAAATDSALGVWNLETGAPLWPYQPLPSLVVSMAVSPDGKVLATGLLDGSVTLWEPLTGKARSLERLHKRAVRALAFSPDSSRLAASSEEQILSLWETRSARRIWSLPNHSFVTALAFHTDGAVLASASADSSITLWAVETGAELRTLKSNADPIRALAINPQGTLLATGSDDQQIRIWKQSPKGASGPAWSLRCDTESLRSGIVRGLAFRPGNDKQLAVATDSTNVRLLNAETCAWSESLGSSPDWVKSVAFSPDGRLLASGADDGKLLLWDLERRSHKTLLGHTDEVHALAFQPAGGNLLASASFDKTVRLWELPAGCPIHQLPLQSEGVRSVDFSPNGKLLATASGRDVAIWKVEDWTQVIKVPQEQTVTAVRFTPDGSRLLTSGTDGEAKLLDIASLRPATELRGEGEQSPILALAIAEDSGLLAVASLGRIRLWHSREEELYAQLWQSGQGWGSWTADGPLFRRDTGGLLWRRDADGSLTSVPPPEGIPGPQLDDVRIDDRDLPERGQVLITARVINAARSSAAYWLRIEGSDLGEQRHLRDSLLFHPSSVRMRLDPGESVDIPVRISLRTRSWWPSSYRFCLALRHAHGSQGMGSCEGPLARQLVLKVGAVSRTRALWILGAAAVLILVVWGFLGIQRRYRREILGHPVIQSLLAGQNPLPTLSLTEFSSADAALLAAEEFRKGLRRRALDEAGLDEHGWRRAIAALDSAELCANHFAESLLTKLDAPLAPFHRSPDLAAFRITLPAMPIYIPGDAVLAVCMSTTMTPQSAVARSKPEELEWPRFVVLIDLSTAKPDAAEIQLALRDAHPGTVFVVLQTDVLKRILLSRDARHAKEHLRTAIVAQCDLRQIVPYRRGNEIMADEECFFFGRQSELERMLHRHRSNFVLVGPRLMGKSSLLNALCRELARRYPRVRVLKHQLFDDSLRSIQFVDPTIRADTPEALFESVMQRTSEHQIFLLDEADKFIEKENRSQYAFCSVMRALHGQGRASFILAGHQELHEATRALDHPLRNFGELIRLAPLDPDSAERMILDPLTAVGLRFDNEADVVSWLREQTGCRPHLLAQLCWALVNMRKLLSPMALLLEEVKEEVLSTRSLQQAFEAWENGRVDPTDRALLRGALLLDRPQPEELREYLSGRGVTLASEEITRSLSRLYAWHYLLIADPNGRLYCPVPLFRFWISEPDLGLSRRRGWRSPRERLEVEFAEDLQAIRQRDTRTG